MNESTRPINEKLQNPALRAEFRQKLAACLRKAWSYRGTEEDYKRLTDQLSDLERWLNLTFGVDSGKRFPTDLEEAVAQAWRSEYPERACVADALGIAAKQFNKRISRILDNPGIDQNSILTVETDGVILPPDKKELPRGDGNGEFKEIQFEERTKALIATLHDAGIHPEDLILVRGKTRPNMMRQTSYTILEIPRLGREVLVCDQVGEGTFVIYGILDRKLLLTMGKEGLQEKFGPMVAKFTCFDIETWKKQVTEALLKDVNVDELSKIDVKTQEGLRREILKLVPTAEKWKEMNIKAKRSFQCLGLKMNAISTIFGLEGNPFSTPSHLELGRKIYGEDHECLREITLEMIKNEIIRRIPSAQQWLEMEYKEKEDLSIFGLGHHAIGTKFGVKTKSLSDQISHAKIGKQIFPESEDAFKPINVIEDLKNAIKEIIPTANDWNNTGYTARMKFKAKKMGLVALATLFEIEGDPVKNRSVYLALGRKIYGEGHECLQPPKNENIFSKDATKEEIIAELKSEITKLVPTPESWAAMKGPERRKFTALGFTLFRIANQFGFEGDPSNNHAGHLDLGRKIYGEEHSCLKTKTYPPRDKGYYQDPEKVKHDLDGFAAGLGENKIPANLNLGSSASIQTVCANGEKVRFRKWIRNAGVALGMADSSSDVDKIHSKIFEILFKTAGIELRDENYYKNPEKIKFDLEAFAIDLGGEMSINDLNSTDLRNANAKCANGELVNGYTWLKNAAVALKLSKDTREAANMTTKTLEKLKEIAAQADTPSTPKD